MVDEKIEKAISLTKKLKQRMSLGVLVLIAIIVASSVIELSIVLFQEIFDSTDDVLFLDIEELFKLFSFVFIILIGFELMETVEMYFKKNVVHAEVVLLVAVIAVSRKVILLDLEKYDPISVIGLGIIILSLGGCYFLIKRSYRDKS
uniref:phosphate-starvation-inducible PsiE family protein n=1 Tax=Thaumasiovibrio occultus TaxID=1891184 RepID=UPI000B355B2C|nr:phosphate-starvation-inducible PsiE family protein [Thaumasiovibrio occultus]